MLASLLSSFDPDSVSAFAVGFCVGLAVGFSVSSSPVAFSVGLAVGLTFFEGLDGFAFGVGGGSLAPIIQLLPLFL